MHAEELVAKLNALAPVNYGMGLPHPPIDDIMEALVSVVS
jgi:hypothetical protein